MNVRCRQGHLCFILQVSHFWPRAVVLRLALADTASARWASV